MKLLTCEYNGRTFAAVSDGKMVYEAAPWIFNRPYKRRLHN